MENPEGSIEEQSFLKRNLKTIAYIFLILTTVSWGSTFIITRTVIEEVPVFFYLTIRYTVALMGFIPYIFYIKEKINKKVILVGLISGLIYFISITAQTLGLKTTSAGKAGFITGLSTIIAPFLGWIIYKESFRKRVWLAAFISVIGMGFLFLEGEGGISIGDGLVLICAFSFGLFIIYNDKSVKQVNVYFYSIIQLGTIIICCLSFSIILNEPLDQIPFTSGGFWVIILYMGIIATTITFFFQNWSQQYVNPATTAIIFALEPVFAALFGFIFGNEILSPYGIFGSILILIAIFITIFKKKAKKL